MALRKLNPIVVVHTASTTWETRPPEGQHSEIIEIGVCDLDLVKREIGEVESFVVQSQTSRVSPFCTSVTGLTQEQVDQGMRFESACRILEKKHDTASLVWASYGDFDRRQFDKECYFSNVTYPFGSRHLNVKTLASLAVGLDAEAGLTRVMSALGMERTGDGKKAGDECYNVVRVLAELMMRLRGES